MQNLKEYIKFHKESIILILVLTFLSIFSIILYHEKDNLFSFVYMLFAIITFIKILFNKINV